MTSLKLNHLKTSMGQAAKGVKFQCQNKPFGEDWDFERVQTFRIDVGMSDNGGYSNRKVRTRYILYVGVVLLT